MPTIQKNGATIYYEVHGKGFPILTFAPAGVKSTIAVWSTPSAPINPITEFSSSYRVIVMDQRNAGGKSRAPITAKDGWHSFTADHIAVLDDLKVERCHLYGQCIGGSFIMSLLKAQPQRVASSVLAQPIGRVGALKPGRAARKRNLAPQLLQSLLGNFRKQRFAAGKMTIGGGMRYARSTCDRAQGKGAETFVLQNFARGDTQGGREIAVMVGTLLLALCHDANFCRGRARGHKTGSAT